MKQRVPVLIPFLVVVSALFIGILIFAYVATKKANPWGLFDMHGNMSEWCWDRYGPEYYKRSPTSDPPGPGIGEIRVHRGGAWNSEAAQTRAASREGRGSMYSVLAIVGLRVARDVEP